MSSFCKSGFKTSYGNFFYLFLKYIKFLFSFKSMRYHSWYLIYIISYISYIYIYISWHLMICLISWVVHGCLKKVRRLSRWYLTISRKVYGRIRFVCDEVSVGYVWSLEVHRVTENSQIVNVFLLNLCVFRRCLDLTVLSSCKMNLYITTKTVKLWILFYSLFSTCLRKFWASWSRCLLLREVSSVDGGFLSCYIGPGPLVLDRIVISVQMS